MDRKKLSEKIMLMFVVVLLATVMLANVVSAGTDKGALGKEKTINLYDLTTWTADIANVTDVSADHKNSTVTNATDIMNVWMCNNYTYLFVRVDVNDTFAITGYNFSLQLYVEDAVKTKAGNDTLLYTNEGLSTNDVNATFLFSAWSTNNTFARYNWTGTQWAFDQALTNATTQGAFNWTAKSFVMMIHLSLLSSNGTIATGNYFKFDVYTALTVDGTAWFATDCLDFVKYTLTGVVIPEFPSLALILALTLLTGSSIVAARKLRRPP